MFDGVTRLAPWVAFLGDHAYDTLLWLNTKFNWLRRKLGFGYWSISKYLKANVKKAVGFVFKFEQNLVDYCNHRNYDGVICGHIHTPEIKTIDGIVYMNDGDWVESCSALVEELDGTWKIIFWEDNHESQKVDTEVVSSNTK
jgi:UDP-2,3-diacylglucosamine pyrophosphatase LpxH